MTKQYYTVGGRIAFNGGEALYNSRRLFNIIAIGGYHSLGIDKNGKLWSWGYGEYGQLGDNTGIVSQFVPVILYGTNKPIIFCL